MPVSKPGLRRVFFAVVRALRSGTYAPQGAGTVAHPFRRKTHIYVRKTLKSIYLDIRIMFSALIMGFIRKRGKMISVIEMMRGFAALR